MQALDDSYARRHPRTIVDRRFQRERMMKRRAGCAPARVWPALAVSQAALGQLDKTPICRAKARRLAARKVRLTPAGLVNSASVWEIHQAANTLGRLFDEPEAGAVRQEFGGQVIDLDTFTAFAAEFSLGREASETEQAWIADGLLVTDGVDVADDRWTAARP